VKVTTKPIITDLCELDKLGRSEEVQLNDDNKLIREIVANIKRTMRKNNLVSLSAPAIGYNKRIFCIDFSDQEIKTFINPLVTRAEGIELTREVCSSIPDKEFIRPRNSLIEVMYQTPLGKIKSRIFKGLAAHVIQHEIDHLDGVTLADIGLEIEDDFNNATDEERFEIINMYLDSLDLTKSELEKDFTQDENLRKEYEADKFVELLAQGKIEVTALQAEEEKEENA
jgi:peptide deformylase